ncbi:hypothetical protein AB0L63_02480 [Nocardia sp. NPDC051990]|uniref:hypothetical protein n=1 Tax=Nocardia sp. NPDC051990 TaxID=3155285 RepID=UPI00342B994A
MLTVHGQCVDFGAQCDRPVAAQDGDDAVSGDTGAHLVQVPCAQMIGDECGRIRLPVAQLGVPVQMVSPLDDPIGDLHRVSIQFVMDRACGHLNSVRVGMPHDRR